MQQSYQPSAAQTAGTARETWASLALPPCDASVLVLMTYEKLKAVAKSWPRLSELGAEVPL